MLIAALTVNGVRYELLKADHSFTLMYGSKGHTFHAATDEEALYTFSRLVGCLSRQ